MRLIFQLKVTIFIFHSHLRIFYFPIDITAKVISVIPKLGQIKIMKLELKLKHLGYRFLHMNLTKLSRF